MKLIVIGSANNSHIVLNSPYVSSYHAEILLLDNGDILLEDKGSRNGTFYNNTKLTPNQEVSIKRGDNIRFANMPLDWSLVPALQKVDFKTIKEMRGIGSNYRNKYQIQGSKVSRFHATMKKMANGKWYIQDHSTNGTTVNGTLIPKDKDVLIKRGDRIMCAGVAVPNPCDSERPIINWTMFAGIAAGVALIVALSIILPDILPKNEDNDHNKDIVILDHSDKSNSPKALSDQELYERYKSSVVYLSGRYYYKVTAGRLNLDKLGIHSMLAFDKYDCIVPYSRYNPEIVGFSATGFFISKDGNIITNLHVAKPWLFNDHISLIREEIKTKLQKMTNQQTDFEVYTVLGSYVSEIKVEGVIDEIKLIPHDHYHDIENAYKCRVLAAGDDINKDVALLRMVKPELPYGCTWVDLEHISDDATVGSHIYTIGFPAGTGIQDYKNDKIHSVGRGGSITQEFNKYSFGHDAASEHGASGSPVFNEYGKLVGVLNAGYEPKQGFNYAIKAKYVKELINESK